MKVSIIIVNYHVQKELFACLASIHSATGGISYEIIVVDNDEEKTLEKPLQQKFPKVTYIPTSRNLGFGAGNNLGVKRATGDYLFFLNPDTVLQKNCIENLLTVFKEKENAGIVAPLLQDAHKKVYQLQGTQELNPIRALFALSFLYKIFPNNHIAQKYWYTKWDKKSLKEVDVIPGSAFMIPKEIFEKIGGFDESFFLFFEENDMCNQVRMMGYHIYFLPQAQVLHFWGASTKKSKNVIKHFEQSRFYYFKKYFGTPSALFVEAFLRIKKQHVFLLLLLLVSLFLRLDRINFLMPLIGDQGWFYLAARDLLSTGTIPLVGITSSHTWLHQGPLWTYIVSFIFLLTQGSPIAPAYVTGLLGVITTYYMYVFGKEMFSQRVGLIAAALFATSPLVIIYTRLPYHTTLIPEITLLIIYAIYKLLQKRSLYLPLVTFLFGVIYNLELAAVTVFFALFGLLLLGWIQKKEWVIKLFDKKIILLSIFSFSLPMFPIYLYDFNHGFPQTFWFPVWIVYSMVKPILLFGHTIPTSISLGEFGYFLSLMSKRLLFVQSVWISVVLILVSFLFIVRHSIIELKEKKYSGYTVVSLVFFLTMMGLLINKTPSEAYVPLLFVPIFFSVALLFDYALKRKFLSFFSLVFLCFIILVNIHNVYTADYYATEKKLPEGFVYTLTIENIEKAADAMMRSASDHPFAVIGGESFASFSSSIDNYTYVLLWKGAKLEKHAAISFFIYPSNHRRQMNESIVYKDLGIVILQKAPSLYETH